MFVKTYHCGALLNNTFCTFSKYPGKRVHLWLERKVNPFLFQSQNSKHLSNISRFFFLRSGSQINCVKQYKLHVLLFFLKKKKIYRKTEKIENHMNHEAMKFSQKK